MRTPPAVMVLAIIGFVLGGLAVLGALVSPCFLFVDLGPNPMMEGLKHDTPYIAFVFISGSVTLIVEAFKITACIASIKLRPWARKGMLIYGCIAIVHVVLASVFNFAYVIPKMIASLPAHSPAATGGMIGGFIGGGFGLLLGLAYPICVLYFFTRPNVVDAFNGVFRAAPSDFPVQPAPMQEPASDAESPFP